MTVDNEVRELLQNYAGRVEPGALVDGSTVQAVARRRDHRRRVLGGAATLLVAVVLIAGIGTALRSSHENTVFAGIVELDDGELLPPVDVVFDGERFVGIAPVDVGLSWQEGNQSFVIVESSNGMVWTRTADEISFVATRTTLAFHDPEYIVVATREASPLPGTVEPRFELSASRSSNLEDWRSTSQILDDELVPALTRPIVTKAIAAEAGLLAQLTIVPGRANIEDEVERAGYDPDEVCDLGGTTQQLTFRRCGTSERVKVSRPPTDASSFEHRLLFASDDGDFAPVELPESFDRPGGPGFVRTFPMPGGFGVAGVETLESTNGVDWHVVDTGQDVGPMIAAREDAAVLALPLGAGNYNFDDPVLGFAYRSGDEPWQRLDLNEIFSDGRLPRWLTDLRVGPGGWVMVAQHSFGERQIVEGVERNRSGASDFILTSDGYVLDGRYPFGPATLTDPEGTVLRTWDVFEATRPSWSGFTVDRTGVWLADAVTGEPTAIFSFRQWAALTDPLGFVEYDVLFSVDGQEWQVLESDSSHPRVLAIGDKEIVVMRLPSHHLHPTELIIDSIALPQDDS